MTDATKKWLTKLDQQIYGAGNIPALRTIIDDLCSRLDAQQEVIDKLPKTADGVPVTPGQRVWFMDKEGFVEAFIAVGSDMTGSIMTYPDMSPAETDFIDDLDAMMSSMCYSTRAAAESARTGAANSKEAAK